MRRPTPAEPVAVLIVEDEVPIAQALAYIVEDAGYTPVLAQHGKQALELLSEHRPVLIITDLMMPQMNGLELIAALRQMGEADQPSPPIVLMSAAGKDYIEDAGADALLPKPFEIAEVEALLHRLLSQS